jgi:hypothetical protein
MMGSFYILQSTQLIILTLLAGSWSLSELGFWNQKYFTCNPRRVTLNCSGQWHVSCHHHFLGMEHISLGWVSLKYEYDIFGVMAVNIVRWKGKLLRCWISTWKLNMFLNVIADIALASLRHLLLFQKNW